MPGARGAVGAPGARGPPGDAGRAGEAGLVGARVSILTILYLCATNDEYRLLFRVSALSCHSF